MAKDLLENFIRNNKEDFDTLEPSGDLWNRIAVNSQEKQSSSNEKITRKISIGHFKWIARVAAAVLIFIGSYYFHDFRSRNNQIADQSTQEIVNSQLYSTLMEAEFYYTAQIGKEKERLYQLTAGNSLVREEIQNELKELDEEFRELKEDLKDNADNEDIIAAMIQNYRLKLRILQDMMLQLQEDKKVKNTNDEIKRIQI